MRIAYVCADRGIPIAGTKGASVHVRAVASALAARGHRVTVFSSRPEVPQSADFEVRPCGYDRTIKEAARAMGDGAEARELYSLMLSSRISEELIAGHAEAPFDAVYERYSLWSLAGLRFARSAGVPHLLEVNAPLVDEALEYRGLALETAARGIEATLLRGASAISVPSAELRSWIAEAVQRERRVFVLPNAVDPQLFESPLDLPADRTDRLDGKFVVAFAGSLKPWHGVELLLEAFDRLLDSVPEAHLLVLGDGPLRTAVEAAAQTHGEDRVTAVGAVEHPAVAAWLTRADVGVAPYPPLERFYFSPLKLAEYQAAGLAVVASQLGQIARRIDHGSTGLLCPPGDVPALVHALIRLARDPALRQRMGRRARRRVLEQRTWPAVGRKVEEILVACGAEAGERPGSGEAAAEQRRAGGAR